MKFDILTLFPDFFKNPLDQSILARAQAKGLVEYNCVDIRKFAKDKHRMVDDQPYGGGPGMVLKVEPIWAALDKLKAPDTRVIYLTPQGERFSQNKAWELSLEKHLILICGRYRGIDHRIRSNLVTDEISIGDYVLTGGEIPALVVIDAVVRMIPGVLGDEDSVAVDSFFQGLLDHPHYTRPAIYKSLEVPPVLLSGDHKNIEKWRKKESLRLTLKNRPDLLRRANLDQEEKRLLEQVKTEEEIIRKEEKS